MTTDHAIEFAESKQSTGGMMTDEAFVALVAAVRSLRELNAELVSSCRRFFTAEMQWQTAHAASDEVAIVQGIDDMDAAKDAMRAAIAKSIPHITTP